MIFVINSMMIPKKLLIPFLVLFAVLAVSCSGPAPENGTLQGNVTIGPISPVARQGVNETVPCSVYQARKIMVYKQNGHDLVKEISIDCSGNYTTELAPGQYIVDINHSGIDYSAQVPKDIEIQSLKTVTLDIDIDTGIR